MNKDGIVHKIMLGIFLVVGFGVAFMWPQWQKKTDIRHAQQAAQTAKELAAAEQVFFEKNGFYTADFTQLGLELSCPSSVKDNQTVLHCPHYDFMMEEADTIRVSNTKYPKWFTVELESGEITCNHEDGSLAGAAICSKMDL